MFEQIFAFMSLSFGIFLLYKLNPIKVDSFLRNEAKRGFFNNFSKDESWNSEGRVYTEGLTLIKQKDGKKRFIQQTKLADTGLLHN